MKKRICAVYPGAAQIPADAWIAEPVTDCSHWRPVMPI